MDLSGELKQREEFRNILFALAQSQELLQDKQERFKMYKCLEALYDAQKKEERFRHFYSDIFSVLTQIQLNPKLGDMEILGQNLDIIRKGYQPQNQAEDGRTIDISDSINKLYDHVNLELARIRYSDSGDRKISEEEAIKEVRTQMNALQSEMGEMQSKMGEMQSKMEETEKKISDQQREYIAILGIFAAVVLAFTGGMVYSTSVLENISNVSIYRIVLVSLVIGFVLLNILFALFYYIDKLVNKRKNVKPMIVTNIIIIVFMLVTIVAWLWGFVEFRNGRIQGIVEKQNENVGIVVYSNKETVKED